MARAGAVRVVTQAVRSVAERRAEGHALRQLVPRGVHGQWQAPRDRPDPVALLIAADQGRIPALLPLRYGRMQRDAFAFLRGSAAIMAGDLAQMPHAGLRVQACGDAHLGNFGAYATPEGHPVFDVTDFDETLPGPFEWDLKRLAVSLAVAGRVQGMTDKAVRALVRRCAHGYRRHVHELAEVAPLEAWQSRILLEAAIDDIGDRDVRRLQRQRLHQAVEMSRQAYAHLLETDRHGAPKLRLGERLPAIVRLGAHEATAQAGFARYVENLAEERRVLMARYALRDVAFKAVGVGSVGTFCAIGLFATADGDTLLLQLKQARPSALAAYLPGSAYAHQGRRVVVGQRMMQAASDVFLGWSDHDGQDFYVRQLKDARLAAVGTRIEASALSFYARLCGRTLARAHARSGDAAGIAGYLGDGDSFDAALAHFAVAYAGQVEQDFARFQAAIHDGRIEAIEETAR